MNSATLANPAIAAILGAVVGGIMSFLGTYLIQYRQRENRRERLEKAISAELSLFDVDKFKSTINQENIEQLGEELADLSKQNEIDYEIDEKTGKEISKIMNTLSTKSGSQLWISTGVYEQNLSNIGLLKKDIIDDVIEVYNLIQTIENDISELSSSYQSGDNNLADVEEISDIQGFESKRGTIENRLDTLKSKKSDLVAKLD